MAALVAVVVVAGCSSGSGSGSVAVEESGPSQVDQQADTPTDEPTDTPTETPTDERTGEPTDEINTTDGPLRGPTGAGDGTRPWADAPEDFDEELDPAESTASMRCNLSSDFLATLADLAEANEGEDLRLAVLALTDHVTVWQTLIGHQPDITADVQVAEDVLALWYAALDDYAEGETAQAQQRLTEARSDIERLPSAEEITDVACDGG